MEKKQINSGGKSSLEIPLETVWVMARTLACQQVAQKPADPPATIMTPIIRLKESIWHFEGLFFSLFLFLITKLSLTWLQEIKI